MTDLAPINSPALPSIAERLIHGFAQKALTAAAFTLASHGALTQSQSGMFVEVGVALVMFAASSVWTVADAYIRSKREKLLLTSEPPLVVGGGK